MKLFECHWGSLDVEILCRAMKAPQNAQWEMKDAFCVREELSLVSRIGVKAAAVRYGGATEIASADATFVV